MPVQPAPLTTVDIPSRPIAADAGTPAPSYQDDAQASVQANAEDSAARSRGPFPDLLAAFRKIPEMLRDDTPVPAGDAPRPPMPVGQ